METSRDYKVAVCVGLASSVLWFFALSHLALASQGKLIATVLLLPVFFVLAISANHKLFKSDLFHKGIKFLIVGVLNTAIDFFVFDTLIGFTNIDSGIFVLVFKSISFLLALFNSYELNRLWTFGDKAATTRIKKEFTRFAAVTFASFLVNVGITAFIANVVHPLFGLSQVRWDNVAAAGATVLNLILNFAGYKLFVFVSDAA
jgi:putative flippase GtrA